MPTDADLLSRYAASKENEAFAELVRRYLPLVYGSARRRVSDPALADDVCQAVFWVLAKKAHTLHARQPLADWLLGVTRYAAANAVKQRGRRAKHERAAARSESTMPNESADANGAPGEWSARLDAALDRLPRRDRRVLLLRYYDSAEFAQIAAALSITESTARRRVSRAVLKLRSLLRRGGVDLAPTSLAAMLPMQLKPQVILPAHGVGVSPSAAQQMLARAALRSLRTATLISIAGPLAAAVVAMLIAAAVIRAPSPSTLAVTQTMPATLPAPTTLPASQWYRLRSPLDRENWANYLEPRTGRYVTMKTDHDQPHINLFIDPVLNTSGLSGRPGAYFLGDRNSDLDPELPWLEADLRQYLKHPRWKDATFAERLDGSDRLFDITAGTFGLPPGWRSSAGPARRCVVRVDRASGIVRSISTSADGSDAAMAEIWHLEPAAAPVDLDHPEKLGPPGAKFVDDRTDAPARALL